MVGGRKSISWEKAIEKAIQIYKKDLDMLREYDKARVKASRPASA